MKLEPMAVEGEGPKRVFYARCPVATCHKTVRITGTEVLQKCAHYVEMIHGSLTGFSARFKVPGEDDE